MIDVVRAAGGNNVQTTISIKSFETLHFKPGLINFVIHRQ